MLIIFCYGLNSCSLFAIGFKFVTSSEEILHIGDAISKHGVSFFGQLCLMVLRDVWRPRGQIHLEVKD